MLGANGLLAFLGLWIVLNRKGHHGLWIAFRGCVLLGWIDIQCILLRAVAGLHILYGGVGVALIVCGLVLERDKLETTYSG